VLHNINDTTEGLILEGMKRFDEWQRVESEMPNAEVVLRQKASAVNNQFEALSPEAQIVLRLVDAERDVASIIRESGLSPDAAVSAVAELLDAGIVEKWNGSPRAGEVLVTGGKLPEATGAIDFSSSAYFSTKACASEECAGEPVEREVASVDSGRESRTEIE
jgi:hypothetical protein